MGLIDDDHCGDTEFQISCRGGKEGPGACVAANNLVEQTRDLLNTNSPVPNRGDVQTAIEIAEASIRFCKQPERLRNEINTAKNNRNRMYRGSSDPKQN